MNQKRVYNALATFGQISIGLQGLSCIVLAVMLLVMGGVFLGTDYDLVPAVVDAVGCDPHNRMCGVGVTYTYGGKIFTGTFETLNGTNFTRGDAIYVRVNPADPSSVSEDLPWRSLGLGMMSGALSLVFIAWYAIRVVSDDRNIAALAGSLSFLRALV
jgi:hypothetical protein